MEDKHLFLAHFGVSALNNPPGRGSGRYPYGSGQNPYQRLDAKNIKQMNKLSRKGIRADVFRDEHVVPAGTTMFRTTSSPREDLDGSKYVTYLDVDREFYESSYIRNRDGSKQTFEHKYTLTEDLKIPSRDELRDTVMKVLKDDPSFVDNAVRKWLNYVYPEGSALRWYATHDAYGNPDDSGWKQIIQEAIKNFASRPSSSTYFQAAQTFGVYPEFKEKVISELRSKGYNAMTDEAAVGGQNGFGREGIDPLIVFDGNVLKETGVRSLSYSEEQVNNWKAANFRSKASEKEYYGRTNDRYAKWSEEM